MNAAKYVHRLCVRTQKDGKIRSLNEDAAAVPLYIPAGAIGDKASGLQTCSCLAEIRAYMRLSRSYIKYSGPDKNDSTRYLTDERATVY